MKKVIVVILLCLIHSTIMAELVDSEGVIKNLSFEQGFLTYQLTYSKPVDTPSQIKIYTDITTGVQYLAILDNKFQIVSFLVRYNRNGKPIILTQEELDKLCFKLN